MTKRPVIGITALATRYIDPPHSPMYALNQRYVMAVEASGGAPLMVPPDLDETSMQAIFERLDGWVLSGGGDVDPAYYGESPHAALNEVNAERDRLELSFARQAVEADKPVIGICRGVQVLNVALGGSLVQDIPTQQADSLPHSFDGTRVARDYMAHPVRIESGSLLREVMGVEQAGVNSWHHQSVKRVAASLAVVAQSPDGIIEAVEMPGRRFVIGVQWHPEWLYDHQPEMKRLFEALVQAAK
ncbi:MAG TPA: gamma-glutamyl-gamma-aminobutyrate hydrolase family protein [Anaerolineae bacterium]|nr:gamma-glutamyl-gamma-aminobutyrate hydrolase family protein [Anaerolineae bacterium]